MVSTLDEILPAWSSGNEVWPSLVSVPDAMLTSHTTPNTFLFSRDLQNVLEMVLYKNVPTTTAIPETHTHTLKHVGCKSQGLLLNEETENMCMTCLPTHIDAFTSYKYISVLCKCM